MSEPNKYREWILETIDSLRSRKARPDLERICRMLRRRHGSDPDRTRKELEQLIQEQTVLKVSYKGSISYRNAAKVQRKGRKTGELTATNPSSSNGNNNSIGDSAHSFTDPEEGGGDPNPGPEPEPCSGNGAAMDWKEEKASAPQEGDSGPHGAAGCPPPWSAHSPGAHHSIDAHSVPGAHSHTRSKTCLRSASVLHRQKDPPPNSKLRGGLNKAAGKHANSDLGGPTSKPLGLKEILGYLSSQERLSEEKLTRGNVKVVMEREVARGRLRRTRCGNITLPLRGAELDELRDSSNDRVAESDMLYEEDGSKSSSPSQYEIGLIETSSEEEEEEEEREGNKEEEENSQSSDEERRLSLVAMTTEPGLIYKSSLDAKIQTALKEQNPQQQHQGCKVTSSIDFHLKTKWSPAEEAFSSQANGKWMEVKADGTEQLQTEIQDQRHFERMKLSSTGLDSLECKTEVSVSSCLLTPTASPRDSRLSEEQGFGVVSTHLLTSEGAIGSPKDWTVSDVVRYFTAAGYPEQAVAFRTQEIDGKSLLLMQRNDVLTGLSIKLGPALKIFESHVKVLQKTHFEDEDC